jgi:myosin XV
LLEKSRIVSQTNDERNYHVFYEFLAGSSDEMKSKYGLLEANKYFYLNQGGTNCRIQNKNENDHFKSLSSAIDILGFNKTEQEMIFKILSAVLHIGNIYFNRSSQDDIGVEIGNEAELKWTSHLLSLADVTLRQVLTHKITETKDEKLLTPFHIEQALDARLHFLKKIKK